MKTNTFGSLSLRRKFNFEGESEGDANVDTDTGANVDVDTETVEQDPGKDVPGSKPDSKLSDKEAELLREVMKQKEARKQASLELQQIQNQLKKFEGVDLESYKTLLQEKQDRETAELERRGEFDRVKEQMVAQHQAELQRIKDELSGNSTELNSKLEKAESLITELTIGRSFGDSSFVHENLHLTPAKARIVFGSHFEVQDGKVVAYDKPAGASERTQLVDGSGNPLSFEKAIEAIVKADPDHEYLLKSKLKTGSGSKSDPSAKPEVKVGKGRDRIALAVKAGQLPNVL